MTVQEQAQKELEAEFQTARLASMKNLLSEKKDMENKLINIQKQIAELEEVSLETHVALNEGGGCYSIYRRAQ